jgi:hypothetical protein
MLHTRYLLRLYRIKLHQVSKTPSFKAQNRTPVRVIGTTVVMFPSNTGLLLPYLGSPLASERGMTPLYASWCRARRLDCEARHAREWAPQSSFSRCKLLGYVPLSPARCGTESHIRSRDISRTQGGNIGLTTRQISL